MNKRKHYNAGSAPCHEQFILVLSLNRSSWGPKIQQLNQRGCVHDLSRSRNATDTLIERSVSASFSTVRWQIAVEPSLSTMSWKKITKPDFQGWILFAAEQASRVMIRLHVIQTLWPIPHKLRFKKKLVDTSVIGNKNNTAKPTKSTERKNRDRRWCWILLRLVHSTIGELDNAIAIYNWVVTSHWFPLLQLQWTNNKSKASEASWTGSMRNLVVATHQRNIADGKEKNSVGSVW